MTARKTSKAGAAASGRKASKARSTGAGRGATKAVDGVDGLTLGTDKLYFKIGEVAEIVGVAAHVLRFWESEFPALRPRKSRTQQRVYRRKDVATLLRIKQLLYGDRFTIEGARKQLAKGGSKLPMAPPAGGYLARQSLAKVHAVIDELQAMVDSAAGMDPMAADPAAYLQQVGGARALVRGSAAGVASRPARKRSR